MAGRNAARVAAGIGANVTILDVNPEKLSEAQRECGGKARTILSTPEAIAGVVKETDLLVSTVLVAGERAPRLVTREMIRSMRPGAVVVDIAIDQGGSLETSRPTTHADPYFIEEAGRPLLRDEHARRRAAHLHARACRRRIALSCCRSR